MSETSVQVLFQKLEKFMLLWMRFLDILMKNEHPLTLLRLCMAITKKKSLPIPLTKKVFPV